MDECRRAGVALWNNWTVLHEPSAFYDLEGFKAGTSTLTPIETAELGDVAGRSLLHLQCHFGLDTLSWARRGAHVTGVDYADRAIALARSLAAELGIAAQFVLSDVYELPAALPCDFDIVFTSYGVLYWLPDLRRWAEVVAHFVKPGGTFFIVEHHPFAAVFDGTDVEKLRTSFPYFHGPEPEQVESYGSYVGPAGQYQGTQYGWYHTLSEILNALLAAGLHPEYVHEFPVSDYAMWPGMERSDDGWWRLPGKNRDMIPLMFSIKATK